MAENTLKPVTSSTFYKMKNSTFEKITMLTAYDYSTAKYIDECGVDSILVGDSLGMTILGYDTTINVTMEDMITFTKAVSRGVKRALVVADMPFLSYQVSLEQTVLNAGRLIQAGAKAVKLEGGSDFVIQAVRHLTESGINVIGHLGFTPQSVNTIGGYYVQGKTAFAIEEMMKSAKQLQDAGAFAIVLEMVPEEAAQYITKKLNIPTIGIGAGKYCDGQVLVIDDIIGKYAGNIPKFVKGYANVKNVITEAVIKYNKEVKEKIFPDNEHSFHLTNEEKKELESINK